MPFLLTLNSGQEAEARKYFSPASQPATPLAPQPAPEPKCGTQDQYNWASSSGRRMGELMALQQRFNVTGNRLFDSNMFNNMFGGELASKPEWKECRTNLTSVAQMAAQVAFQETIRKFPAMEYQYARG